MHARLVPCRLAFKDKKTTVRAGPNIVFPMNIFVNVAIRSRLGMCVDNKSNQKCKDGPNIIIPNPPIRRVRTRS